MSHVGFTGTRHGMSPAQIQAVTMIMERLSRAVTALVAHHGDCIGSDEDFHDIARCFGARVESHPGQSSLLRAAKAGNDRRAFCKADVVHDVVGHFPRNRRIVDVSVAMIATPFEPTHQDHGGTWYTVDYAMNQRKPLALVLPRSGNAVIEFTGGWAWPELPKELTR